MPIFQMLSGRNGLPILHIIKQHRKTASSQRFWHHQHLQLHRLASRRPGGTAMLGAGVIPFRNFRQSLPLPIRFHCAAANVMTAGIRTLSIHSRAEKSPDETPSNVIILVPAITRHFAWRSGDSFNTARCHMSRCKNPTRHRLLASASVTAAAAAADFFHQRGAFC